MLEDFLSGTVAGNLGLGWADLLLIVVLLVTLIFFAMSFRIGLITAFVVLAATYVGFYEWGLDTLHVFTIFVGIGVIMIASLFISMKRNTPGVIGL